MSAVTTDLTVSTTNPHTWNKSLIQRIVWLWKLFLSPVTNTLSTAATTPPTDITSREQCSSQLRVLRCQVSFSSESASTDDVTCIHEPKDNALNPFSEKPCSGSRSGSGTARVPASSNTHVSPPPVISLAVEGLWRSFCNGISVATSPVTPVNRHVTMAGPSDCEHRSSLSVPITRTADRLASVNIVSELRYRGYVVGPTLGKGTYAKVKSAYSESAQHKVAIKIVNKRKAPKDFLRKFLPRELHVLININHENIIKTHEILNLGYKVCIVMDMAGHGDLLEYIKLRGRIPDEKATVMFGQLISALDYLHNRDIVHRDLKCENVLLDVHNNVKLTDFGFTRHVTAGELSCTYCGSTAYASPEVLQGISYWPPAYDVWSTGVILFTMVSGYMPFDDSNIRKMVRKQYGKQMDFPRKKPIRAECQDLILSILEADVNRRATIKEILAHPWLQGVSTSPPPPPARHTEQGHSDVSHKELHPADGYMTIRRQDALVPIATGSSLLHMPDNSVHKVKDKDMYESLTVYSAYHDKAPYGEHQCCPHHAKVKDSGRKTALGHVTEGGEATDVKKKTFRHFFSRGQ